MALYEERTKILKAPCIIMYKENIKEAIQKGTILFYHGLKASKETSIKEIKSFAQNGFLSVGIDNVGHGERIYKDMDEKLADIENFEEYFFKMVRETTDEIPQIVDYLISQGFIKHNKIGISGISMGGYIAYGAILAESRIKVAVPILGSPVWNRMSPHNHPDKFYPTALLSQNAGLDESVPAHFSRDFNNTLKPFYKDEPQKLSYKEYPKSGHFMKEDEWNSLWDNTLKWFEKHI